MVGEFFKGGTAHVVTGMGMCVMWLLWGLATYVGGAQMAYMEVWLNWLVAG